VKEIAEIRLPDLPADLIDLDVTPGGSFVAIAAIVDRQPVRAEGRDIGELSFYREQRLLFGTTTAAEFPDERPWGKIVRAIDEDTAIVVERGFEREQPNAWIVDRAGQVLKSFRAGQGIEDVVVCGDYIAVTYFDEGIFRGAHPSPEGVSIFNRSVNLYLDTTVSLATSRPASKTVMPRALTFATGSASSHTADSQ